MTLKEHIEDIAKSLEQGMFPNKTEVCDKIVHRILDILNWPRYDHGIRLREYDLSGLRVDFALCHPASEPQVFIEVKRIGNIDGAEDQLFGYASRENVPIAVLTDGRKWQFFYPSGLGNYDKRKVDELDMKEGDSEENAELFNRYLSYEAIRTGEAAEAIQGKYEDLSKQRQIEKHLPDAWKNLVENGDELLLELVAEATKELCSHSPTNEQVLAFLKTLERKTEPPIAPSLKRENFTKSSHRIPGMKGKLLSGPQDFIVKGKRIFLSAQQVEELKTIYKEDRERNPNAGPGGAVKQVLVAQGLIPSDHVNHAWNAVARIVGHLTPVQKRSHQTRTG